MTMCILINCFLSLFFGKSVLHDWKEMCYSCLAILIIFFWLQMKIIITFLATKIKAITPEKKFLKGSISVVSSFSIYICQC